MTIFGFASVFTAFTYISPILLQVTGFQENGVTLILVLFGLGVTIRNLVGGKLADWKLMPSIIVLLILQWLSCYCLQSLPNSKCLLC
ncbi:hypothetical protein P3W28_07215 [Bacillus pumilus]|uniref:hypothetical protein n=1 Tax=Bacillus pumilus TaxID=1408 RepID=UPI002FF9D1A4